MSIESISVTNTLSPEQHEIAELLGGLSGHTLITNAHKTYISLDEQMGKSTKNKNAVSISKRHVAFMVSDWSAEGKASALDLLTKRNEKLKRLKFPGLTVSAIRSNSTFFQSLLADAKSESEDRQKKRNDRR